MLIQRYVPAGQNLDAGRPNNVKQHGFVVYSLHLNLKSTTVELQ